MASWTYREVITGVHGLLFGMFFLLATYALFLDCVRGSSTQTAYAPVSRGVRAYLVCVAGIGWAAVLSGTFLVYPWYRAKPPAGADLHSYPRSLLLANPSTATLHTFGMEWKEHVAFLAPIAFTMVAYVVCRYGGAVARHPPLRRVLLGFSATALLATAIAGGTGALLNKAAPVTGAAHLTARMAP